MQAALESTARPFDAIVLDIVMHRSDGALICKELRQRSGLRAPIIAMTGNTRSSDLQRYYAMGFDVVLPKPFTRESLGRVLVEGRERCVTGSASPVARTASQLLGLLCHRVLVSCECMQPRRQHSVCAHACALRR